MFYVQCDVAHKGERATLTHTCDKMPHRESERERERKRDREMQHTDTAVIVCEAAAKNLTCPRQSYTLSLPRHALLAIACHCFPPAPLLHVLRCQFDMRFVIHILHKNAKRQSVINC